MDAIRNWLLVNNVFCFVLVFLVLVILLIAVLVNIRIVRKRLEGLAWVEENAEVEIARYKRSMNMYKDEYERIAKIHDLDVAALNTEIKQLKAENKLLKKRQIEN